MTKIIKNCNFFLALLAQESGDRSYVSLYILRGKKPSNLKTMPSISKNSNGDVEVLELCAVHSIS